MQRQPIWSLLRKYAEQALWVCPFVWAMTGCSPEPSLSYYLLSSN